MVSSISPGHLGIVHYHLNPLTLGKPCLLLHLDPVRLSSISAHLAHAVADRQDSKALWPQLEIIRGLLSLRQTRSGTQLEAGLLVPRLMVVVTQGCLERC